MADSQQGESDSVGSVGDRLLQVLLKPQIIVAMLTAVAGPLTVVLVNQQMQETKIASAQLENQRSLQTQILTEMMRLANEGGVDVQSLQKISLLTSFIKDNQDSFGLVFPSVPELITQAQRLERNNINMELASLRSSFKMHEKDTQREQQHLLRLNTELQELQGSEEQNGMLLTRLQDKIESVEQQLRQENDMGQAIQRSILERQQQIAAMDQFVEQEAQRKESELSVLVDQLKSGPLDQQSLAQATDQLLQAAQSRQLSERMMQESFSSIAD
jgi:hypothetical protein